MPDLFEQTSERLTYKFYSDATINPSTEPTPASDPGASGGQILRHVSHNLSLAKEAYAGEEIRTDKQRPMEKHGTRRVPGTVNGLLSPKTQEEWLEAALGGTWSAAVISANQSDFTSVSASNPGSSFTFAAGNPVTKGFRASDIVRFTNLSDTDNNSKNFVVLGFSGTQNRIMSVYPAPDTMTADTSFSLVTVGRSLIMPSSAHVKRKLAVEVYNSDGDIARLFTEGRVAGFTLQMAPNQDAQINFTGAWRNRKHFSAGSAPFFTAPTAETTTEIISSMDGLLVLNGAVVAITTGLTINFNRAPSQPAQLHTQGLTPGTVLANAVINGEFTAFLADTTFMDLFDDQTTLKATEFGLIAYLPADDSAAAAGMTFFLPRVKINSNNEQVIDGAKAMQCGFAAARYFGAGPGIESTSIRITDTDVT